MGVNARGDRINSANRVVDSKVKQVTRQYNKQIGPQDDIPQATADSKKIVKKTPVAPDPIKLQKTKTEETKKVTKPKPVKAPPVKESRAEDTVAKPAGGLADAIARAKTIKQEALKTPRQQA